MLKKNRTLHFLLVHDVLWLFFIMVLWMGILWIVTAIIDGEPIRAVYWEVYLLMFIVYGCSASQSFMQHDWYITFGFCRGRFYREQVVLCGVRAVLLSALCSVIQFVNYDNFVAFFIEDTDETAEMYHRIPLVELFLTKMVFYFLVYIIFLLLSIHTINFRMSLALGDGMSPHLKQRSQMKKERNKRFWICRSITFKLVFLCGMVAAMMGNMLYQQQMMTRQLPFRLGCMAAMVAASVLLYFVGKKRFSPKYI